VADQYNALLPALFLLLAIRPCGVKEERHGRLGRCDMAMRIMSPNPQKNYIRAVAKFGAFHDRTERVCPSRVIRDCWKQLAKPSATWVT
jgi:hypothetical protein